MQEVYYNVLWTYCQKLYSNCKCYLIIWYSIFVLGRYFRLQCKFSSCIPCDYRYPKCEDKDDGIFMATGKDIDFTRKYMVCKDKRRISTDFCPYADYLWGGPTYLYKGKCSHLYEIPTDFNENGRLPSCKGKLNGNYQFPDRPCDAYYRCLDGIASPLLCPYGTVFDVKMNNCLRRGNCTFSWYLWKWKKNYYALIILSCYILFSFILLSIIFFFRLIFSLKCVTKSRH